VLVVDDEDTVRRINARFLRRLGCSSIELDDGSGAVLYMQRVRDGQLPCPDALLMDIIMQAVHGDAAAAQIRAMGFDALPLIAATSNTSAADQRRYLAAGFNHVLTKPFDARAIAGAFLACGLRPTGLPASRRPDESPTSSTTATSSGVYPQAGSGAGGHMAGAGSPQLTPLTGEHLQRHVPPAPLTQAAAAAGSPPGVLPPAFASPATAMLAMAAGTLTPESPPGDCSPAASAAPSQPSSSRRSGGVGKP
jgi:CheY-like chemotaxis protein